MLPSLHDAPRWRPETVSPFFAARPLPTLTSLTTSLVGALPVTSGTLGWPFAGGVGLIGAHLVGAAGGGVGLVEAVRVGVGEGARAVVFLLSEPERFTASRMMPTMTTTVPTDAPMMVLRRRCLARRSISRIRRRS